MTDFGLVDYLMIVVMAGLSWGFYYAAQPPPTDADKRKELLAMRAGGHDGVGQPEPMAAPPGPSSLQEALLRICGTGGCPDAATFLEGAKLAYELIIKAYADDNLSELEYLLTSDVRDTLVGALAERRARGETQSMTFIGFRTAEITDAGLDDGLAWIDVHFVAELVSVTRDQGGGVVAGDPGRVVDVGEVWTFERELRSSSPAWFLAATAADK